MVYRKMKHGHSNSNGAKGVNPVKNMKSQVYCRNWTLTQKKKNYFLENLLSPLFSQ